MKEKFDKKIELNRVKVKEMVLQRFHRWLKVFGKIKSERILVRKPWNHAINLKENFVLRKESVMIFLQT